MRDVPASAHIDITFTFLPSPAETTTAKFLTLTGACSLAMTARVTADQVSPMTRDSNRHPGPGRDTDAAGLGPTQTHGVASETRIWDNLRASR